MPYPPPTPDQFPVEDAWRPIPDSAWNASAAAHCLRRIGFSATPEAVESALRRPCGDLVRSAFRRSPPLAKPAALAEFEANAHQRYTQIYREVEAIEERQRLLREIRREDDQLFRDFGMLWFVEARRPEYSAREKFVLFLQDVFVVERQKVRETPILFNYQTLLREGLQQPYPEICKAISRSPAMIRYLDLDRSSASRPNENFARELFELFTLGEGNYTESDISEAARAFTGYRIANRYEFIHRKNFYDPTPKTVFSESGRWEGDDIIDLVFQQPAARTFLIRELVKFYLTDASVDEAYLEELGTFWARRNFDLRYLIETFFQSRLFHHTAYRGNLIKSPIHFYIGLCQDLRLDIVPFEARLFRSLDAMGQSFFNPPNVRGWLYGANWINSTTISARRHLVNYLFAPLNPDQLNGNEQIALNKAIEEDRANFLVTGERLGQALEMGAEDLATHLSTYFISEDSGQNYRDTLVQLLESRTSKVAPQNIRHTVIALLQSPAYNLC